ncbi:hypothetical protein B0T44_10265 [Nocardia donostiensis]|uniref:HTH marR-type domain-containing protein n=1 Tax=Nocardia donostiensis TaxID=1538463 RepID=A0A1V2TEW3_9NOCA|nr:hypothetical protein B0T46_13605 [Nocardia donostiensis]OQS20290.1 hypothetical protein B0T44_10265 [Nocardia donostiensis]
MRTARPAAELHTVSYQAANEGLEKLVQLGLIRPRTEGRNDRFFVCDAALLALHAYNQRQAESWRGTLTKPFIPLHRVRAPT